MSRADAMPAVRLQPAGVRQAADLARLHASLFDPPWNAASFADLLAHPGAIAFVARGGNPRRLVGFILGRVAADEAEILTLGVAKDWQRSGVGGHLVEMLCRAAKMKMKGAGQLHLEVAADNAAALALYHRFGFRETGRRAAYYARSGAPPEDAVNLCLDLSLPGWHRRGRAWEPHL